MEQLEDDKKSDTFLSLENSAMMSKKFLLNSAISLSLGALSCALKGNGQIVIDKLSNVIELR